MRASLIIVLAGGLAPGCSAPGPMTISRAWDNPPSTVGQIESQCQASRDRATPAEAARARPGDVALCASRPAEVVPLIEPKSLSEKISPSIVALDEEIAPTKAVETVRAATDGSLANEAEVAAKALPEPVATDPTPLREPAPPPEPSPAPPSKPEPSAVPEVAPDRESTAPSTLVEAGRPKGRPVAQVGDEVITLPELTRAVKARIGQLPPGESPSRRQVIALARSVLKGMVVRSLVLQEAREVLGGPEAVAEAVDRLGTRWDRDELKSWLRREGVAGQEELRGKLASRSESPESIREEFIVRSIALELMRREPSGEDLDGYLTTLRRRRPITSIMSPAELVAAGAREAAEHPVAR